MNKEILTSTVNMLKAQTSSHVCFNDTLVLTSWGGFGGGGSKG